MGAPTIATNPDLNGVFEFIVVIEKCLKCLK